MKLSQSFIAEMISNAAQEVAPSGLCLQELPILLFGKIEIAIDIAAAEAQPQDAVPAVICRCSEQFRFKLLQSIIAVGMTIADHPPHRSVLAELPHTAPPLDTSVEALIGIGMKSTRARNPSIKDRPQLFPIRLPPLTATT